MKWWNEKKNFLLMKTDWFWWFWNRISMLIELWWKSSFYQSWRGVSDLNTGLIKSSDHVMRANTLFTSLNNGTWYTDTTYCYTNTTLRIRWHHFLTTLTSANQIREKSRVSSFVFFNSISLSLLQFNCWKFFFLFFHFALASYFAFVFRFHVFISSTSWFSFLHLTKVSFLTN